MLSDDVKKEFIEFGNKMHTLGILLILLIIPFVNFIAIILWLIYIIIMLGIVKRINLQLNNKNLKDFRFYYILSFLVIILGVIVLIIIAVSFINAIIGTTDPDKSSNIVNVFSITISIVGGIIGIIVAILQVITWKNLYTFFLENNNMFPSYIGSVTLEGSKYLKNAMILALIGAIIGFFIGIVGMVIGIIVWILSIIGYFKLGNLRNLGTAAAPSPGVAVSATPSPSLPAAKRFCQNCGTPISGQEKYCSSCGSEL